MSADAIWRLAEGGLERIPVQGGWIYRDPGSGGLTFVPAPASQAPRARPVREVAPDAEAKAA